MSNLQPFYSEFPSLMWEEEDQDTRPLPLHERPMQARIDTCMVVIAERHMRLATAIEQFWGHPECVAFMKNLILSGDNSSGHRAGFKSEVLTALMELIAIHQTLHP